MAAAWPRKQRTNQHHQNTNPLFSDSGLSSNEQLLPHHHKNLNNIGSFESVVPSLSNASTSAQSLFDDESHSHTRFRSQPYSESDFDDSSHQQLPDARRLFSEEAILRILSPPDKKKRPDASVYAAQIKRPETVTSTKQGPRYRLNSNTPAKPPGFPYCNSTNALYNQTSVRMSLSSQQSSANSSDDVDLDLSWDAETAARHIGIDMGLAALSQQQQPKPACHAQPAASHAPPFATKIQRTRSRCRSAIDLTSTMADRAHIHHSARPDSPLAQGWSFNRTAPSPEATEVLGDNVVRNAAATFFSKRSSGSLRDKRAAPAPLRWLDRSPAGTSSSQGTPATLGTSFSFEAEDSGYSSPATSYGPMTPRTPGSAKLPNRVPIIDEGPDVHSQEGHVGVVNEFGSYRIGLVCSNSMASSAYKTAPSSIPISLMSTVEQSRRQDGPHGLGLQHVRFSEESDRPDAHMHQTVDVPSNASRSSHNLLSPDSAWPRSPSPQSPSIVQRQPSEPVALPSSRFSVATITQYVPGHSRSNRSRQQQPFSMPFSTNWFGQWLESNAPAKSFFILGFFLMPWFWFIGGWMLRPDGEFWGTRGAPCRCSQTQTTQQCPADAHRALRLLGVCPSGRGLQHDVDQLQSSQQDKAALLNVNFSQASGFILANRVAAIISSAVVTALFAIAIVELCKAL